MLGKVGQPGLSAVDQSILGQAPSIMINDITRCLTKSTVMTIMTTITRNVKGSGLTLKVTINNGGLGRHFVDRRMTERGQTEAFVFKHGP